MKVLMTASSAGHIRSFHLPYIDAFRSLGWETHVACGGVSDIENADRLIRLPFEKSMFSPNNFKATRILKELIQVEHYDLICTHTSLAAFFTRLAVKGMKEHPRVVNVVHGYLFDDETSFPKKQLLIQAEKLVADVTDVVLTMNEWDFKFAKANRLGNEVGFIHGIGVDFDRFMTDRAKSKQEVRVRLGLPEDKFLFIYAAEFSKRKSQTTLIEAMQQLPENTMLILAGDGRLRDDCMKLTHRLELEGRILFPGHVANIGEYYRASDAAASASRSEGMPFHLLEAAYFELPIVATRVKGHTDLMQGGFDITVFKFGDSEAAASAMKSVVDVKAGSAINTGLGYYSIRSVMPEIMRYYGSDISIIHNNRKIEI